MSADRVPDVIELGAGRVLLSGKATEAAAKALRFTIEKMGRNGVVFDERVLRLAEVLARQADIGAAATPRRHAVGESSGRQLTVAEVQVRIDRCERQARRVATQLGYLVRGRRFVDEQVLEEYLADRAMSECPRPDVRSEGGSS